MEVWHMTYWRSLLETVGIPLHLQKLPSDNSSSHRDFLPAFDHKYDIGDGAG